MFFPSFHLHPPSGPGNRRCIGLRKRVHHWRPRGVLPHAAALACPPPRHRLSGHPPHTLWLIFKIIPTILAAFPPRFAALPSPVQIHAAVQIP